jgi:alkylhydroperoxidase/carboxymuconolactone decarboxylase family protein YurZ
MSGTPTIDRVKDAGRWNPLWDQLAQWDPAWTEQFLCVATAPWASGVLAPKTIELICIGGDAVCTHLYEPGTRRHIRAALDLGATREEILEVLKLASLIGLQACHVGAPILDQEIGGTGAVPAAELVRRWDPQWAEQWDSLAAMSRSQRVLDSKTIELLCIGINVAATHLFGPAVRQHVRVALAAGVTREEIFEVIKLASTIGIHACNLGVPLLAEELAARAARGATP